MARTTAAAKPHKRDGYWYLIRRLPNTYSTLDPRPRVVISTGIRIADDPRGYTARIAVAKLDAGLNAYWRSLKAGNSGNARHQYDATIETARTIGIDYTTAANLAQTKPVHDIVDRLDQLDEATIKTPAKVYAILGGVTKPALRLSDLRLVYEEISATELRSKSKRQLHRWQVIRDTAVNTFINVLGEDKQIADLTRTHVLQLRAHWQTRVTADNLSVDTANKNITRIAGMYRAINDAKMLGLPSIFDKAGIRGGTYTQRLAYPAQFIQDHILASGIFDDINAEARRLIYLITETGLRPSEACSLTKKTIFLNTAIPHIKVRPEGRQLKTIQSLREIPLVGVAFLAMKAQPEGFPHYRDRPDTLTAVINKALTSRNLRPHEGQSLYSLRHTFEDRLTNARCEEKVIASLMGHKYKRPRYGTGPSLELKAEWLNKIAFRPPVSV